MGKESMPMLTEINIHLSAWIVSCARPPPIVLLCPGYLTWVSTYSKYVSYIHLKHHQTSEKTGTGASIHPLSLYLLQVCFQRSARRFVPAIVPLSCLDRGRTNMERSIRSLPAQTVTGHSLRPSVHVSRSPAFTKHPIDDNRVGMAGLIVILKRYTAPAYTSLGLPYSLVAIDKSRRGGFEGYGRSQSLLPWRVETFLAAALPVQNSQGLCCGWLESLWIVDRVLHDISLDVLIGLTFWHFYVSTEALNIKYSNCGLCWWNFRRLCFTLFLILRRHFHLSDSDL